MKDNLSPNSILSHYRILSQLGAGGMGEVYLAEDTKLGRKVALKLLPAEFTKDEDRVRRFIQEAKAASALNHSNIITIYEIGEVGGTHFIATEFIDGQTLRQQVASTRMRLPAVLEVAIQVASALAAAHVANIVHRDIKPENIMVRHDGITKVLDFGVAKLTARESTTVDTQAPTRFRTEPGTMVGTAVYMSPEQARGMPVDARTDIFSLGIVLYEMVAGCLPFEGSTSSEVLASILGEKEPQPLARYSREVPAELERIVEKALCKDREERYQVIKDMLLDLKSLKHRLEFEVELERLKAPDESQGEESVVTGRESSAETTRIAAACTTSSVEPLFSKIKRHKRVTAVALAILTVAIAAVFLYHKRAPALTDRDTILLADYDNKTGDAVFDGTLKQALAVHLGQSPFLNIFSDERVRETLRRMNRSPDERVTPTIGREICQRQGLKAMLTGSIVSLGRNYVISLEAVNAQTDEALAREQSEAEGKEQVLRSLGQAATRLREKLGESLSSIQKFDAPIEQVTTSSLEALRYYSLGVKQHSTANYREAIPLYKRATELDPNFAIAYARLAACYNNTKQLEFSRGASQKAYELRGRVSEREKLYISSSYYGGVTGEWDKHIEALELWQTTYPRDWEPFNLLCNRYTLVGPFEKAIGEGLEAVRLNPKEARAHANLAVGFMGLNRFDEAKDVLRQALAQKLETTNMHTRLYQIAFVQGDQAAVKEQLDWALEKPDEYLAQDWQAQAAEFAGQLVRANQLTDRAVELAQRRDLKQPAALELLQKTERNATFGNCRAVAQFAEKALALSLDGATLIKAGNAFAACGQTGSAQSFINELSKRFSLDTLLSTVWLPVIRAQLELNRGNAAQAIQLLEPARKYQVYGNFWPQYLRAQAYLKQGKGAEAAMEFQTIIDHRGWYPLSPLYPLAHVGLARAEALQDDTSKARKEYQDFFALWKDADADLPILIEAKKEYEKLK